MPKSEITAARATRSFLSVRKTTPKLAKRTTIDDKRGLALRELQKDFKKIAKKVQQMLTWAEQLSGRDDAFQSRISNLEAKIATAEQKHAKVLDTIDGLFEENRSINRQLRSLPSADAQRIAESNRTANHERSSGALKSPFGEIADQGLGRLAPGSFESRK